jgi:uncharacterized protein YcfJ
MFYSQGCRDALRKLGVAFNNPSSSPGAGAVGTAEKAMGTVGNIAGGIAGGALGTAVGGPIGSLAGGVAGSYIGEKAMSQAPKSIKNTAANFDKTYNASLSRMNAAGGAPTGGTYI